MKFSVIIPTYNRANIVLLTIDSLLHQDFPREDFEIIIVDNNSTDNTEELIQNIITKNQGQANIRYAKELRQGDVYARNSGASIASGEYLYFTDDDALFDTSMLHEMANILDNFPQVAMVGSRITIKWDAQPPKWIKNYEYLLGAISCCDCGFIIKSQGMCIPNGSLAIRKNVFFEVGGNNPGQIGEWLVGNAEVGLFHKIRDKGYLIAFSDDTTMWHMQKRAINGTMKDILRRIENIAISDAYGDVIEKGLVQKRETMSYLFKSILSILFLRRTKFKKYYFAYRANKKYNEWIFKYADKAFLDSIIKSDYILNAQYLVPKIKYYSTYAPANSHTATKNS